MAWAELGKSRGYMSHRLRTIIAGCIAVANRGLARSMLAMWAKFAKSYKPAEAGPRLLRRLFQASEDKLFFRRTIFARRIAMCAIRADAVLPIKSNLDSNV